MFSHCGWALLLSRGKNGSQKSLKGEQHGVDVPVDKPLAVVIRRGRVDLLEAHQIFARRCRLGDGEVELVV
jgi:hypothetical protein